MKSLAVEYRLDTQTQRWTATVPEVPAILTQGATLEEAHDRVRSALALVRDDASCVVLRERVVLGPGRTLL